MPSDLEGFIDYEKIKEKIKAIIDAKDFKVLIIDSAGNVISDISLSALRDDLRGANARTLTDLFNKLDSLLSELQPVSARDFIASANNTAGLTVTLDKGGRRLVDVYYKLGGASDLIIEVSSDGSTWRPYYSTSFSASAEDIYSFETSFRYVRVRTPTTGIDVEFEITATR